MDYSAILRELYKEREMLDRAIEQVESLGEPPRAEMRIRRRRRSMAAEERKTVSARTKKYWNARQEATRTLPV